MPTIATRHTITPSAQRRQLDRLHTQTQQPIRAAFHLARQNAGVALARFTAAYGAELARVREASEATSEDEDARVSLLWLHTSGHLDSMRGPVMRALQEASHTSLSATLHGQRQALQEARTCGAKLVQQKQKKRDEGPPLVIPPIPAERYGVSGYDGRPLYSYFDALPPHAWARIQKAIAAGMATGQSANDLLNALLGSLGSIGGAALLIAEAEITSAWRDMLSGFFGANRNAVTGWRWRAAPDACDFCAGMDGTIHDVDEEMDSHPRCRCLMMPLNAAGEEVETNW